MPGEKKPPLGSIRPRIRVLHLGAIALGPGKADLLESLARTGSLRESARELGMSYMRAWSLVRTMNASFRTPLVATRRGGQSRGGAALTPTGERVLALYRRIEARALRSIERDAVALRKLLARSREPSRYP
jgi:molybdate transport system regulatory protein